DHLDGADGLSALVFAALADDQPVKSSPPSVAEYLQSIEEAAATSVVVITPAAEFTAMYSHAKLACDLAGRRAVALDSRTATAGQGLVVLAGARAAAAGADLEAVVLAAEIAAGRVHLVASVAELQTLWHRGWVPNEAIDGQDEREAGRDGPRTLFRFRSGAVEPLSRVESSAAAMEAIYDEWAATGGPEAVSSAVFHAEDYQLAARLRDRLGAVSYVCGFSAAMGIHTGRGVVGAAWMSGGS
ncbi:MAG: DegV family protein, partial [Acidimicrobiales bacterium]